MIIASYTNAYTLKDSESTRFSFSKITSDSEPINKIISLANGKLDIHHRHQWLKGSASVHQCCGLLEFKDYLERSDNNEAIVLGRITQHETWFDEAVIEWVEYGTETPSDVNDTSVYHHSIVTDFFKYKPNEPALMLFDVKGTFDTPQSAWNLLCKVDPTLKFIGHLTVHSTTSYIKVASTGKQLVGADGFHFYCLVKNGADIPRYGDLFAKRAWLLGHGRIEISDTGDYLQPQLVNTKAFNPSNAIYEAPPDLDEEIVQERPSLPFYTGGILDSESFEDLDQQEESYYLRLVRDAKALKDRNIVKSMGANFKSTDFEARRHPDCIRLIETYT